VDFVLHNTQIHTDHSLHEWTYNSAQADHFLKRVRTFSLIFLNANVSRLFARGPFFLHLESGGRGGKGKSEGAMALGPLLNGAVMHRTYIGKDRGVSPPTTVDFLWSRHLTFFSYFIIKN